MDAVTAVSGSSPAYVFMMIEAMADAAVIAVCEKSGIYIRRTSSTWKCKDGT